MDEPSPESAAGNNSQIERDYQLYTQLLELWSRENSIKTQKLQYFLLTNALLIVGLALPSGDSQTLNRDALICLTGSALSLVWVLSLGRTILFQRRWGALLGNLSKKYGSDNRFHILTNKPAKASYPAWVRLTGSVSSKYYLIGSPIVSLVFWLWLYTRNA